MGDYRRLTRLVDWYPAAQHRRESSNVQELNTSVPRVSTRKSTHWCPSKPPTSCGFFLYSSASGFRQARVKSAPWQVAAAPAPQTTSVVTPLPVEVVNTAGSRSSHDSAKTIAALPTATLQAEQFPASPPQDQEATAHQHRLPDGTVLELLELRPSENSAAGPGQPPLLFVHGASHGAWCWAENFFPWLTQHGHHCFAVSLRGHGKSDDESKACPDKYAQTSEDLAHVIASLPQPPVLVAHSMGGFFAQRYLINLADKQVVPAVAGVVMMASASLTACLPDVEWWRAQQSLMHAVKVIWWMMTSQIFKNAKGDKAMLFSRDVPDRDFQRYHHMLRSGRQTLPATFKELQAFLPKVDKCSEACKHLSLPIAVMMAGSDTLIMQHQIQASAKYFGVEPIILPGLAHDIMLDTRWESAAEVLDEWLRHNVAAAAK